MKNSIDPEMLQDMLKKAKEDYFNWPKELYCPALEANVRITRSGWDHLINKKLRTKVQTYWRAKHLKLAKMIIEKTTTVQTKRKENTAVGNTKYWGFCAIERDVSIEVVIRQVGNQPKHFYSLVAPKIG